MPGKKLATSSYKQSKRITQKHFKESKIPTQKLIPNTGRMSKSVEVKKFVGTYFMIKGRNKFLYSSLRM